MKKEATAYDVFLSFALADAKTGELAARTLTHAGLTVFAPGKLESGAKVSDAVWQALAEIVAMVAIVDPENPPAASLAVELGAAMAWHKPIYIVHAKAASTRFPDYLSDYPAYPISRLEDVARSIAALSTPLSADELSSLCHIYGDLGIPTDQLLLQPAAVEKVARAFAKATGREVPAEQLVHELIRLRKGGSLPKNRTPSRRTGIRGVKKAAKS